MTGTGDYNRKVIFKEPAFSQNDEGGEETTYPTETLGTWANIKRTNQVRALEAGATALINSDVLKIRLAADRLLINENWIVVYDGKEHLIHSIDASSKVEIVFIVKAKTAEVIAGS